VQTEKLFAAAGRRQPPAPCAAADQLEGDCMKLIFAIVSNDDSSRVSKELTKNKYSVTKLATTGGFLMAGNTTFLIGTDDDRVDDVIRIIGMHSKKRTQMVPSSASYGVGMYTSFPVEVQVGGATIFVTNIERFEKL
jgi:uncharacterized protein YaaQ